MGLYRDPSPPYTVVSSRWETRLKLKELELDTAEIYIPSQSAARLGAYRDALSGALLAAKAPVIDKLVEACALTFTKVELEDINRFYVSSSGKAWLEKGRVIMLPVLEKAVDDVAPQVAADVERRFCAKIDCTPAKASPPSPRKDRTL